MRIFQRLLMATPSTIASQANLGPLLPPIPLFRRILRVHRKLSPEMRILGDAYVKSEFRAHRNIDNPIHIVCFRIGTPNENLCPNLKPGPNLNLEPLL
jgi:Complex 1 protein (LYR family).